MDRRWVVALAALAAFLFVLAAATSAHPPHTDWDQIYQGARVFLAGGDPYATVRHDQYPSYYPATAYLVAAPFVWLPFLWAQAAWAGVSTAAFTGAMTRRGRWGLLALASAPCVSATLTGQWSPLLVGATASPWLGGLWAAKPTIGLALFAAYPSKRAAGLMLGVMVLSLLVQPAWPVHWLSVLGHAAHVRAPITRPGGFLLLLGIWRWRTPEGRLLAMLAIVPQSSLAYELLPLFLIPRTPREMAALVVLSQVAFAVAVSLPGIDPAHDLAGTIDRWWPVWLVGLYLPALWLALRPTRPYPSPPAGVQAPLIPSAR